MDACPPANRGRAKAAGFYGDSAGVSSLNRGGHVHTSCPPLAKSPGLLVVSLRFGARLGPKITFKQRLGRLRQAPFGMIRQTRSSRY